MNDHNPSIYQTQKPAKIFYISAVLVALFVLWGAISPSSLSDVASRALDWMITTFGWFYMLITAFFVLFIIVLAISPYGKIKLGKADDHPDFSWFSWIGMLFAAGIGVGFVFWGVAEPVLYYVDPPVGYDSETRESAIAGLRYGSYHWALHPWAIFSIVGLTLAYVQFRKDRPALISSAFYPIFGEKVNGKIGQTIDLLAVLATCTGVATTFGLSAMQITGGLSYLTPIPNNAIVQIIVIAIVSCLFMISAARGLDKGIKILSNLNIVVAALLFMFVIIVGPTLFIAESFVTTLGGYIANLIPMSLTLTPFSESEWLGTNTIFFWAWHISWAPFVGLFIARISKGRTVREFITGVLLVPALVAIIWFTTFGGTALNLEMYGPGGIADLVMNEVELALFVTLGELPLSLITSFLSIILIFIFFITSADSATYVLGSMTSRGSLAPSLPVQITWGLLIAGTASVLLLSGGGGLTALQTASLIAALPFAVIMLLMSISLLITFKRDWDIHQKERQKKQIASVKREFRDEFLDDVKEEVRGDVISNVATDEKFREGFIDDVREDFVDGIKSDFVDDIKGEFRGEFVDEVKDEFRGEFIDDIKGEFQSDFVDEVKDEFRGEFVDDIKGEFRSNFVDDVKSEFRSDIVGDVKEDLREELIDEIKEDIYEEMKFKMYDDIKDEIYAEMKGKFYKDIKEEIYEEVKREFKKEE